jgi:RNA polymerase sigma-70 factor (ECF subfamily)
VTDDALGFPSPRAALTPQARTDIEDHALLARLHAGEEAAFSDLIREQGPALLSLCRRLLGHEEDARDAVQEAFLSAFKALPGFQGESRLSSWLHRIAVNAALMRRRAIGRRREELHEAELEDLLPRFTPGGHHVEVPRAWAEPADAEAQRGEDRELLRSAIDRLPETYRIPLVLKDLEELETEAVAEHLGITVNATKIRVHRARQALRTMLDRTQAARSR